jgi:ABC-type ATPase with predicted acetyltransferase domain
MMSGEHVITIRIEKTVSAAPPAADSAPSMRVLEAALMFGLGADETRSITIVPPIDIPLPTGGIVFITGPSGGGKSTMLELIAAQCENLAMPILRWAGTETTADEDELLTTDRPLVDVLGDDLHAATSLLSMTGLGDAFVMLRRPRELSDGQRARLRLALAIDTADRAAGRVVMLADEFLATLDRLTAHTVAANLRRWISRTSHTFIAATTHDDLLEALAPDVLVCKGLGEHVEVLTR